MDVDFSTRGRLGGIVKRESSTPKEVLDDSLLQMRGVVGNFCLEALDHVVRIVEGTADRGFCTVHEAMKAIGGLLPIVGANMASIAVVDGGGDEVDVSIEKIDALKALTTFASAFATAYNAETSIVARRSISP